MEDRCWANARGGFSARVGLSLEGIQTENLLRDLLGASRVTGVAQGRVDLLAVGDDMAALMGSLDGDGWLNVNAGTVRGFDLLTLM